MAQKNIRELKVGTRGSALALTQTKWVVERIKERHPEASVEIVIIKTTGDNSPMRRFRKSAARESSSRKSKRRC